MRPRAAGEPGVTTPTSPPSPVPPQGVWHLGPLPLRAYAICIIVGIVVGRLVGQQAVRRPRRPARPGHRHLGVGGAVRHHRRPDLPRHHRQPAVLPRGPQPLARVRHLERRPRHLGRDRLRRGRRLDRLPLLQGAARRPTPTPSRPGSSSRRPSAGSATTSTRSCSAAAPRCRGGWRSSSAPPAASPAPLAGRRRLRVPHRLRSRPTPEVLCGIYQPTFLYELLWNLRRRRA